MKKFFDKLQRYTEKYLTFRKIRKEKKLEKQRQTNPVLDWIKAFLWAAMVVLLVNQYFFQAYQIPSGSMMNTLLIRDRIFVNKFIYGPELIPGMMKLPGMKIPKRGDIIIFESPAYLSRGPVFDIFQRIIYMVTLSLIDIDKDENGDPKPHFLIKRAVGAGGDRIKFVSGRMMIRPAGAPEWIEEEDFKELGCEPAKVRRIIDADDYDIFKKAGYAAAYRDCGLPEDPSYTEEFDKLNNIYVDGLAFSEYRYAMHYAIDPSDTNYRRNWKKSVSGWYIPKGWVFPLGENRDNSRDGRYFGPIHMKKVLGQSMFIYWPLYRIGNIK